MDNKAEIKILNGIITITLSAETWPPNILEIVFKNETTKFEMWVGFSEKYLPEIFTAELDLFLRDANPRDENELNQKIREFAMAHPKFARITCPHHKFEKETNSTTK